MVEIYVLNAQDELITTLTEENGLISTNFREELNGLPDQPFSFTIHAEVEEVKHVLEENQVVFKDKEGQLRLFVIKEIDDSDDESGAFTTAVCEPAFMELKENIILEKSFIERPVQEVLDAALQGTRWIGNVELDLGLNSIAFNYESSINAIWRVINLWGGEIKDTVEFNGNKIITRKIHVLARRGSDRGKRFEIGFNMQEIQRTILSYPITALYGRGAALSSSVEENDETGKFTKNVDFSDVVWKKSSGDPVDKPAGQKWVGDPEALQKYGREHNGKLLHREGEWQNGEYNDPEELLKATWEQLQRVKFPEVNYRLAANLLETMAGYEHEKITLGDTARAVDRKFSRPIEIQARVIAMEYDLLDIEGSAIVEMGQALSVHAYDDRLDRVVKQIDDNSRKWDEAARPIDGNRYPDIVPPVPSNVKSTGLFSAVFVEWDFNYVQTYIQGYEVFASEVKGFLPSPETLVFRGSANSYSYQGEANKQYYFRVRAFNYHQNYSLYSGEVSATTARIISEDILFGTKMADELRELSKTAQILADNSLSGKELVEGSIINSKIAQGAVDMHHLKSGIIDLEKMSEDAIREIRENAKGYTDEEIAKIVEQLQSEIDEAIKEIDFDEVSTELRLEISKKAGLEYVEGRFRFTDLKLKELDDLTQDTNHSIGIIKTDMNGVKVDFLNLFSKVNENVTKVEEKQTTFELNVDNIRSDVSKTDTKVDILTGDVTSVRSRTTTLEQRSDQFSVAIVSLETGLKEANETLTHVDTLLEIVDGQITQMATKEELKSKVNTDVYNRRQTELNTSFEGIRGSVTDVRTIANKATGDITSLASRASKLELDGNRLQTSISTIEQTIVAGGRNLLHNSTFSDGLDGWWESGSLDGTVYRVIAGEQDKPYSSVFRLDADTTTRQKASAPIKFQAGKTYTLSWELRTSSENVGTGPAMTIRTFTQANKEVNPSQANSEEGWTALSYNNMINRQWNRYTFTFTPTKGLWVRVVPYGNDGVVSYFREIQLEEGTTATPWRDSPTDDAIRINKAETAINQTNQSIQLRAQEINALGSRVSKAESDLTVQSNAINARVTKNGLVTELNLRPESVKIKSGLIHLAGNSRIDDATIQNAHINNLSGDKILANTISTRKLMVADLTNFSQVNVDGNRAAYTVVTHVGYEMFRLTGRYGALEMARTTQCDFKLGDYYNLSFRGRKDSAVGNVTFIVRIGYTDSTWENAGRVTIPNFGTSFGTVSAQLEITTIPNPNKKLSYVRWFTEKDAGEDNGFYYMRDIILQKMHQGEMIVDGTLEARHLRANTITANSGVIATAAIGTAAIANGAITRAKLERAIIGTAQIEDGAISNAKIGSAAIDTVKIANGAITNAKISDLSASKLTSGTINTASITIRGGSSTNYTIIQQDQLHTRGNYNRSWFEGNEYIESETTVGGGMVRISKLNDPRGRRNLYLTNNGLSTYVGGADGGEGFGSGVIEFWSHMFAQDRRGLSLYSNLGTIGLRTDSRDIILWSARNIALDAVSDISILSTRGIIKISPRIDNRAGTNDFYFNVKSNSSQLNTDGWIQYGDPNDTRGSGIRFGKNLAEIHITNYNGDFQSGTLWANDFRVAGQGRIVNSGSGTTYVQGNSEVRITKYLSSELVTLVAKNVSSGSSRTFKSNIKTYEGQALDVINGLHIVNFDWNSDLSEGIHENRQIGVISEDSPFIQDKRDKTGKSIDINKLIMYNTKATQELSDRLDGMQSSVHKEIKKLKKEVRQLNTAG